MSQRRRQQRTARRKSHAGTPQPRPRLTLEDFAQAIRREQPQWHAAFILTTKPAETGDDDEQNGELFCDSREGYDLRLLVKEIRAAADHIEQQLDARADARDDDEACESCGAPGADDFLSVRLAITESEEEEEAFVICGHCSNVVRRSRDECHTAHSTDAEDGAPPGCAVLELSKFDDALNDEMEAWVLCGEHTAALTEWLRDTEAGVVVSGSKPGRD